MAVAAERAVLSALEAPCSAPIGALAEVVEDLDDDGHVVERLSLRAVATTADGALVRGSATGETEDASRSAAHWPRNCSPTGRPTGPSGPSPAS